MLAWGVEVAEILNQMHARGVMHGDIKPQNINHSNDCISVIDFGYSFMFQDRFSEHHLGHLAGTHVYASVALYCDLPFKTPFYDFESLCYSLHALKLDNQKWHDIVENGDRPEFKKMFNLDPICSVVAKEASATVRAL